MNVEPLTLNTERRRVGEPVMVNAARDYEHTPGPADVILGVQPGQLIPESAAPSRASMFGPRGCWAHPDGPLVVADTGNHRLLIWHTLPTRDATKPDLVLGQPNFDTDDRNAGGQVNARSLFVPTGVLVWKGRLIVADSWNHRVLIWHKVPQESDVPADLALGQASLGASGLNRGGTPRADTLYWPYGIATDGVRLYVADSNNRRVLIWNDLPFEMGQPADLVLGQPDFESGAENAGGAPTASSMRWPHALASDGKRLLLADAGNNRVLVWNELPTANNTPADLVLGQSNFREVMDNRGYQISSSSLRFPYAVVLFGERVVVADTGNSRLLTWGQDALEDGAAAETVFGQHDFLQSGENRWRVAGRDTLCWPYGLSAAGGVLAVADSGNNRLLLWHGRRADE